MVKVAINKIKNWRRYRDARSVISFVFRRPPLGRKKQRRVVNERAIKRRCAPARTGMPAAHLARFAHETRSIYDAGDANAIAKSSSVSLRRSASSEKKNMAWGNSLRVGSGTVSVVMCFLCHDYENNVTAKYESGCQSSESSTLHMPSAYHHQQWAAALGRQASAKYPRSSIKLCICGINIIIMRGDAAHQLRAPACIRSLCSFSICLKSAAGGSRISRLLARAYVLAPLPSALMLRISHKYRSCAAIALVASRCAARA